MVQFKTFTFFLVASTVLLPSLAVPLNSQGSDNLLSRDYEDGLVERDITMAVEPLFTREINDNIDLEAREPGFNIGKIFGAIGNGFKSIFGRRELDETENLVARDYTIEEDLD